MVSSKRKVYYCAFTIEKTDLERVPRDPPSWGESRKLDLERVLRDHHPCIPRAESKGGGRGRTCDDVGPILHGEDVGAINYHNLDRGQEVVRRVLAAVCHQRDRGRHDYVRLVEVCKQPHCAPAFPSSLQLVVPHISISSARKKTLWKAALRPWIVPSPPTPPCHPSLHLHILRLRKKTTNSRAAPPALPPPTMSSLQSQYRPLSLKTANRRGHCAPACHLALNPLALQH